MDGPVTVLVPVKLAQGKTVAELITASHKFQQDFVNDEPDVLRRELIKNADGTYTEIVQFSSLAASHQVMEREMKSAAFAEFITLVDMTGAAEMEMEFHPSLATH